jgi:uncharacterized protein YbdZ (MbtH family)
VVAGQSFGGLAAMFAALNWPQRFGCVLSQSGSYWWPHRGGRRTGFIEQLRASAPGCASGWKPGSASRLFFAPIRRFTATTHTQQTIFWRQVDGGHDALCWRGGLTAGLIQLWQPLYSLRQEFDMQFSNPFDNPQGQFYILRNDQQQYSLWPRTAPACRLDGGVPAVGRGVQRLAGGQLVNADPRPSCVIRS